MKRFVLIAVLVVGLADTALAESWLCIEEANAGVTHSAPFISNQFTVEGKKYIATVQEDTDRVELKPFGDNSWAVDCSNSSVSINCKATGFDFLLRKADSSYYLFSMLKGTDGKFWLVIESGNCSTI